ncbi:MAG: acyltransferase family protein, partial [Bacteroidota bacterium]
LHCIGLSLLSIIGIYVFSSKRPSYVFPSLLLLTTVLLFVFEPIYKQWSFDFLPYAVANYFTKANGSVFTIIPWLGYASIGAFISVLFNRFKTYKHLHAVAIGVFLSMGALLIFFSSPAFVNLFKWTGILLFKQIELNNYLFIRLGDVFVVFALFMLAQAALKHRTILKIGSNTLSIYVIHFIILYGSFTGLGLYRFFDHSLSPLIAIPGAIAFMVVCTGLALQYDKREQEIKTALQSALLKGMGQLVEIWKTLVPIFKELLRKGRDFVFKILRPQRS